MDLLVGELGGFEGGSGGFPGSAIFNGVDGHSGDIEERADYWNAGSDSEEDFDMFGGFG